VVHRPDEKDSDEDGLDRLAGEEFYFGLGPMDIHLYLFESLLLIRRHFFIDSCRQFFDRVLLRNISEIMLDQVGILGTLSL